MTNIDVQQIVGQIEGATDRERKRSEDRDPLHNEATLRRLIRVEGDRLRWLSGRVKP